MSTSTTNYGLTKAATGEQYSLPTTNTNLDLIDTAIKGVDNKANLIQPQSLILAGGYAVRGSGYAPPSAYRVGDVVHLRGSITNSVASSPAAATLYLLATLPAGHGFEIPSGKVVEYPLNYRNTSFAIYDGVIQVLDDPGAPGTTIVRFALAAAASIAVNAGVLSLNNIHYLRV